MDSRMTAQQTILGGAKVWSKGGNPYHDPKTGQFTSGAGSDDQPIITVTAPRSSSKSGQHWSTKNSSVRVPEQIRQKIDAVAKEFYKSTGKELIITDGMRSAQDRAKRMLYKFKHGDFKTYRGHVGASIAKIFRDGINNGEREDKIIDDMKNEINLNLKDGHIVSYHLVNRAVDFSVKNFSSEEKKALHDAI